MQTKKETKPRLLTPFLIGLTLTPFLTLVLLKYTDICVNEPLWQALTLSDWLMLITSLLLPFIVLPRMGVKLGRPPD